MAIREAVLMYASDWSQYADKGLGGDGNGFRVTAGELIYIFNQSGAERSPSQADANRSLTRSTGAYIGNEVKHWCGVFACTVLREAGIKARWTLFGGKMVGDGIRLVWGRAGIQPGDVAIISDSEHHFLITKRDEKTKTFTTLEGNTTGQKIVVRSRAFTPQSSGQTIYAYYRLL